MAQYRIAHLHEQGQDMIIVPLDSNYGSKPSSEQEEIIDGLQMYARSAGLAGTVVPVWNSGRQMMFIAPRQWHPFFQSIDMNFVARNINRTLTFD